MGKHKKKHSKKDTVSEDILDVAALSIKKFRKVTNEIAKLSTGQKVAGSLALLAAGLVYLDQRKNGSNNGNQHTLGIDWPRLLEIANPAPSKEDQDATPVSPVAASKSRKSPKSSKTFGPASKKTADSTNTL